MVEPTRTGRWRRRVAASVGVVVVVLAGAETVGASPGAAHSAVTVGRAAAVSRVSATSTDAASVPADGTTPADVLPGPLAAYAEATPTALDGPVAPRSGGPTTASTPGPPPAGRSHPGVAPPSTGSVSDPHQLLDPATARALPAVVDSTPLAAAAGTEPGSMAPLAGIPAGWVSSVHRLQVGTLTRSYLMLRPAAQAGPLPVVMVLHGRQLTPAGIERLSRMPATTGPAILVYPAGYGRSWNAGGCCGSAHLAGIDDVRFLLQVVHQVQASQHDAAAKVYVVGYSNGGRMAYRLTCAAPGAFAGVAAVEAVPVDACPRTSAVPIMIVASVHDPLLTIADGHPRKVMQGYVQPTVQTTVDTWRRLDGCTGTKSTAAVGLVSVTTWTSCAGTGRVAYALYSGGTHAWPGGTEGTRGTPSAEDLLWGWLQRGTIISAA